jgi:hypothetical protein
MDRALSVSASDGAFAVRIPERGGLPSGEYAVLVELRPLSGATSPLSDTLRLIVPSEATVLGEPVYWRRGPSTGPRYVTTAEPRFQRSERLRVEFAVAADGPPEARLLDRLGHPLQVPVQVGTRTDAEGVRWVVADATLAPLAAGEYAIDVRIAGATGRAGFRVVP